MTHTKRPAVKKTWPIKRKGTKFIVVPRNNKKNGIPLLIVMRDILKLVKNRKELKRILNKREIKVNGKIIRDEKYSLLLFDVVSIEKVRKNYRVVISKKGKIKIEEASEEEKDKKISKIIGKKILKKAKKQINLSDGRNILVKEDMKIGDSVVFNFVEKKIEKILPLKSGAEVLIIKGKHLGEKGKIEKIEGDKAKIKDFEIDIKYLMAIENI